MKKVIIASLFFVFLVNANLTFAQEVVSVTPLQNAINVSKSTNVSVTFDQDMNPSTINGSTFIVYSLRRGLQTGTYTYNSGTRTATFDPDDDFAVGEIVSVILATDIEDAEGDTLRRPYEWSFTVEVDGGSGTFAERVVYAIGSSPRSVFSSDLDGDRDMDLAVANSNNVSVLFNNGDGTFAGKKDYGVGNYPMAVFPSDLDGDGYMDLAVANYGSNNVSILKNNGDGTFAEKKDYGAGDLPTAVFSSDLDRDGDLDLAVVNYFSENVSVLKNNGDGTFAGKKDYGVGNYPMAVFPSDLDGDGDIDLSIANNGSNNVSILKNNGDGTFEPKVDYGVGTSPTSVFSSALDGDGDLDLAVTNAGSHSVSILLNNGDGTFGGRVDYSVGINPISVFSSDLDGDGDLDLAVANFSSQNVSILLNNSDGSFTREGEYYSWYSPYSVFSSDLDADGDLDLAIANSNSDNISILFNNNSFITITSPNGGEEWEVGTPCNITWTSAYTSGTVKIEYSIDNGLNWIEIVPSMPDTGIYSWTIPNTLSDSCLVRVSDTDGSPSDISDEVFRISPVPYIILALPNGGEELYVDSTYNISWNSVGTSGSVKIEYSIDNGSSWTEIIASMPDTGIFKWTVPNTPSDSCLVRISDTDGSPYDISDEVFRILPLSAVPEEKLPELYSMDVRTIVSGRMFEVRYALPLKSSVRFEIYDLKGAKIEEITEEKPAGSYSREIDMAGKPVGVYFLKMEANRGAFTKIAKIVLINR
ncbi:MAG: FG-GAP-like repeat-containing protein [candidate division WOR-3 bacterium]